MMVGKNMEAVLGIMTSALLSLAVQLPVSKDSLADFYILDFDPLDGPQATSFREFTNSVPHKIEMGRKRELANFINILANEVQQRNQDENTKAPSKYLIIYGLQKAHDLKTEDGYYGGYGSGTEEPKLSKQFETIYREGPDVGIHLLVWCDTTTKLGDILERRSLKEFTMRVAFQMTEDESRYLLNDTMASKLKIGQAVFYDDDNSTTEKFRPYAIPEKEWIKKVGEQLQQKNLP
jgi:hypothetical protein